MRCVSFLLGLSMAMSSAFAQRLVTVNFAAADAEGRPGLDLTAAEIQIAGQGKAAAITACRNEALRSPAGAREVSNRPGPALSHIQVIVLDLMNIPLSRRKPA